jgi:IPT/TIG domain
MPVTRCFRVHCLTIVAALTACPLLAGAAPSRVFFSDLQSGPNAGGERDAGVYVTIYGKGFGSTRGDSTVTIGGGQAAAYPLWTDTKITLQLGPKASTGNIVVTVDGQASNGIPFTVRAGNIYFVDSKGSDTNSGSFAMPWRTIQNAISKMSAGDTIYVMDGVAEANPGTSDGSVSISTSGRSGSPNALIAYPGATATIGAQATRTCYSTNCVEGLGTVDPHPQSWWVIAGLRLHGNNVAFGTVGPATDWRIVGNDISCPYGDGSTGCVVFSQTSYIAFYGNSVRNVGWSRASAEYQGLYFSTDSNHLEVGWNVIANVQGCRGLQVHSSPLRGGGPTDPTGRNQYDIVIHDNLIHDITCDGMVISTIDPSKGKVEIYNNIIYSVGKGPLPPDGGGNFSGIYITGETNLGAQGGGTVDIYNNTLYDCGGYSRPNSDRGVSNAIENGGGNVNLKLRVRNNIIYQKPSEDYFYDWGTQYNPPVRTIINGSHNLFYGSNVPPPSWLTDSIVADPLFVNLADRDFHLQSFSPAHGAGINLGTPTDKDGVPRPPDSKCDLGAYQHVGSPTLNPNPEGRKSEKSRKSKPVGGELLIPWVFSSDVAILLGLRGARPCGAFPASAHDRRPTGRPRRRAVDRRRTPARQTPTADSESFPDTVTQSPPL